jgi:hypothetical protein
MIEFGLFVKRTRAGIHSSHAGLINHAYVQIIMNPNLAREAHVDCEFSLHSETIPLEFAHFTGLARKNFNTASGATSVATTAMEDVDSGILNHKN